jgi:hypothetical protein
MLNLNEKLQENPKICSHNLVILTPLFGRMKKDKTGKVSI